MEAQTDLIRGDMYYLGFDLPHGLPGQAPSQVIYDARDHSVYVELAEKPMRAMVEVAGGVEEERWAFGPHAEAICRLLNKMPAGDMTIAAAMEELELMVINLAGQFAQIAGMLQESLAGVDLPARVNAELDSLRLEMLALAGDGGEPE